VIGCWISFWEKEAQMATPVGARVVGPGKGTIFSGRAGGYTLETKATDDHTRGAYAFQQMTVAPGFPWIPPHIHHNEDEALYGLEGEIAVRVGDQVHAVGAGTYVLMPRGIVHTFSNPGTVPAKVLVVSSPGAVIGYFEEAAALTNASPTGQPDMEQLVALARRYGIEFVG
jgi:mannose-6-phosphate isomerase-like protein (cupin superfamily)